MSNRTVAAPRLSITEPLRGAVGVGTVWAYIATVAFLSLGYNHTPLGYGTALVHTLLPTVLVVGVFHEFFGHYWVAEKYCGYEATFAALGSSLHLTLASLGIALGVLVVTVFDGFALSKVALLLTGASPGAVLITANRERMNCNATVALSAYVLNFLVALEIWWFHYAGSPVLPNASMKIGEAIPAYTLFLSIMFAAVNAIPIAYFDGTEAFWDGGWLHKIATVVVLIGSVALLASYVN